MTKQFIPFFVLIPSLTICVADYGWGVPPILPVLLRVPLPVSVWKWNLIALS
jgi:hypothetical protein